MNSKMGVLEKNSRKRIQKKKIKEREKKSS
jgi:hypothetical protein